MTKAIPGRGLNSWKPEYPGTVIRPEYSEDSAPVRAIVHKDHINLISLISPPMLQQHGFLAKVFTAAERHAVDVDLVATSEISITMTADREDNLPGFCEELSTLGEVQVEKNHALVCVVGQGMAKQLGIPAQVLGTLPAVGVRVRVISQRPVQVHIGPPQ